MFIYVDLNYSLVSSGLSLKNLFYYSISCKEDCVCAQSLDGMWLFVTPWIVAHQAPLSMRFSRQGFWIGSPFPPPGDLLDPEIELKSPASPRSSIGKLITTEPPRKADWLATNSFHFCVSENDFTLSFSLLLVLPHIGCALNCGQHFSKPLFILLHVFLPFSDCIISICLHVHSFFW